MDSKNIIDLSNLTELEKEDLLNNGYLANCIGQNLYSEEYVNQLKDMISKLLEALEFEHTGLTFMLKEQFKEEFPIWYEIIKNM